MKQLGNALGKLNRGKKTAVIVLWATTAIALPAQTFTTLFIFDHTHGALPYSGLVQAANGDLYGTTVEGGAGAGEGTVFKITPSGTLTTLHTFDGADGLEPYAGLVQAANGEFYGATPVGGANNNGTVFKMTPSGALTTLYSFCSQSGCADGSEPYAVPVQAANGDFYGTTTYGGANGNYGTIFKMTPSGTLTTLYSFCSQSGCTDGYYPYAGLVQATNGDLYGTTYGCGPLVSGRPCGGNYGTIFKMTPSGTLTTLYSFCSQSGCTDGAYYAGLVQAINGDLYGTTTYGGANGNYGTIFKITPRGTPTTLYSFCSQSGCTDGEAPYARLVQATNGEFYGTAYLGGANGYGAIFEIAPSGALTTLHSFDLMDGAYPDAALVQDTDGTFYGTTYGGSSGGVGVVFSLSVGLGPFVETEPTSGKVGVAVKVLGTNLTGATSVTFSGTAAVFKVVSSSEITTNVPAGATTGAVQVVAPGGTLSSNVPFRVP